MTAVVLRRARILHSILQPTLPSTDFSRNPTP
ncbi:uncharacterized protein PODANS_4_5510 [Podospora anserina S mat+]|uniref:Podospora anserina S mat+ genomic DNA chromosome 4, supercontig 4 n=1 Tax=Podospora anserina (strain S / ATCC MYA-4624 / DSM 980 / FGSC 10383) TaxID=515849 RepID=B2AQ29_PODAN|nr:uncharacterized protein PODANS_4_5510 [Podospora anserina S mat+]CAP66968.1 unnamed protein product [Podospora anserina S mat+]CDP28710.1 Putative protein of unknown function [Podospora anserina S mat+]